jgi:hypothetical protein
MPCNKYNFLNGLHNTGSLVMGNRAFKMDGRSIQSDQGAPAGAIGMSGRVFHVDSAEAWAGLVSATVGHVNTIFIEWHQTCSCLPAARPALL